MPDECALNRVTRRDNSYRSHVVNSIPRTSLNSLGLKFFISIHEHLTYLRTILSFGSDSKYSVCNGLTIITYYDVPTITVSQLLSLFFCWCVLIGTQLVNW